MIAAHDVQIRFVVGVQAVDSYCDPEHVVEQVLHDVLVCPLVF